MWMSNFAIYLHLQLLEGANTVGSIVVVYLSLLEIGHRSTTMKLLYHFFISTAPQDRRVGALKLGLNEHRTEHT